jgi:hypothetical protein
MSRQGLFNIAIKTNFGIASPLLHHTDKHYEVVDEIPV